jgi:DNA-binding HxlR family transcriptional regulator
MAITEAKSYECKKTIMAVHDAMYMLGGKWKISIVTALCFHPKRYSDVLKDVEGISGKMLSRELKELETNKLVKRTVLDTQPVTVQYELTPYGQKLKPMIDQLALWGSEHRKMIVEG